MSQVRTRVFVVNVIVVAALAITGTHNAIAEPPTKVVDNPKLPAGAAGRIVSGLIDIINCPDVAALKQFAGENYADPLLKEQEQHRRELFDLRGQFDGVKFHSIRTYEPPRAANEMRVIVRTGSDVAWLALMLTFDQAQPDKLAAFQWTFAMPPEGLPKPQPVPESELVPKVTEFVDGLAARQVFSGVVLIARRDEVLLERVWGLANRDWDIPCTIDTKFNLASMNKMFTAVAVAQLVEQGKLSYTDTIDKYLDPTWLPAEVLAKIRIEHLLTHTSGLDTYHNEKWEKSSREVYRELADYKSLIVDDRPAFPPGAQWSYSNTGFHLLGAIVEKASGENYFDYIRAHVYKPAGMNNSDCYPLDYPVARLAVGYSPHFTPEGPTFQSNIFRHVLRGGPAGGGFSTARDLLGFARALQEGKLVSKESLRVLWTPRRDLNEVPSYAMGFHLGGGPGGSREEPNPRIVGHGGGGGDMGISSELTMHLDTGYVVIVLSNTSSGGWMVNNKILSMLPG
jgi:CubicO group peptidase (beta-lactamase class C family)